MWVCARNNEPSNLKKGFYAFKELSARERRRMGRNARKMADEEFNSKRIVTKIDVALTKLREQWSFEANPILKRIRY